MLSSFEDNSSLVLVTSQISDGTESEIYKKDPPWKFQNDEPILSQSAQLVRPGYIHLHEIRTNSADSQLSTEAKEQQQTNQQ